MKKKKLTKKEEKRKKKELNRKNKQNKQKDKKNTKNTNNIKFHHLTDRGFYLVIYSLKILPKRSNNSYPISKT